MSQNYSTVSLPRTLRPHEDMKIDEELSNFNQKMSNARERSTQQKQSKRFKAQSIQSRHLNDSLPSLQHPDQFVTPSEYQTEQRQLQYIQKLVKDKKRLQTFSNDTREELDWKREKALEKELEKKEKLKLVRLS